MSPPKSHELAQMLYNCFSFQIVTNHLLLHQKALDLLVRLFESSFEELDVLVRVSHNIY